MIFSLLVVEQAAEVRLHDTGDIMEAKSMHPESFHSAADRTFPCLEMWN